MVITSTAIGRYCAALLQPSVSHVSQNTVLMYDGVCAFTHSFRGACIFSQTHNRKTWYSLTLTKIRRTKRKSNGEKFENFENQQKNSINSLICLTFLQTARSASGWSYGFDWPGGCSHSVYDHFFWWSVAIDKSNGSLQNWPLYWSDAQFQHRMAVAKYLWEKKVKKSITSIYFTHNLWFYRKISFFSTKNLIQWFLALF